MPWKPHAAAVAVVVSKTVNTKRGSHLCERSRRGSRARSRREDGEVDNFSGVLAASPPRLVDDGGHRRRFFAHHLVRLGQLEHLLLGAVLTLWEKVLDTAMAAAERWR